MDANNNINFNEFIYNLVNDFYSSYILKSSKPQQNQWTLISALILENNNKYKIICFSNGTKSLPNVNYKSRKFQIFDCHTEILTLRCFKFFLLNTLIYHLDKLNSKNLLTKDEYDLFKANDEYYDIFDYNEKNHKFKIKNGVKFHLYISENPCGECSNIEYNNKTGSKTLEEILNILDKNNIINNKKENNSGYKFRTKSIRSDFKINNLSYSLSCSDKIMIRNILGYQGKYLSFIFEPIFVNSFIINNTLNSTNENINIFKNCIDYNYRCINKKRNIIPEIYFVNHKEDLNILKENRNDKNSLPFSTYWYFPDNIKKVDPSNGIKTGGNIKDDDKIDFLRVKISNYDLCEKIFNLLINHKYIFEKEIQIIEKNIIKNEEKLDFSELLLPLIDKDYIKIKKDIFEENNDMKKFIGKKRKILKFE